MRGYAGVRPLVAADNDPTGRKTSRGIVLIDHEERDGLAGFITITGGKLMTYRLMAEWATDLVCKKLNNKKKCTTATDKLPGSQESKEEISKRLISLPHTIKESTIYRHGDRAEKVKTSETDISLVCECEQISVGEVNYAIDELDVHNLVDLRRRTRVGMGTCQGELCACRAAGIMKDKKSICSTQAKEDLSSFINERWSGIYSTAWGDSLRESEYTAWVYNNICGLTDSKKRVR